MVKLEWQGNVGDARKYTLTDDKGQQHKFIISNAEIAVEGGELIPLVRAIVKIALKLRAVA